MRVYHWLTTNLEERLRGERHVKGGMMRLPEAIAASLQNEVRFGKAAIGIRCDEDGVEILCGDDSRHRA
jgi:monoamine oxidase